MARVSSITSRLVVHVVLRAWSDVLFAIARRFCRRSVASICHESSDDQLHPLHHWLHGFCDVTEEGLLETTIWPLLLGPYESVAHCRLKVRKI